MTDGRHRREAGTGRPVPPVTLFLAASLTGACGALTWLAGPAPAPPPTASAVVGAVAPERAQANAPTRIRIERIGVQAGLEQLFRQADGGMATPRQWDSAGWYAEGVLPGDRGSAVIAGHRDSAADGPAVFYRLGELRTGDDVTIVAADGAEQHFVVVTTEQVSKADFPTARVYAPSTRPLLRLVTCTGAFDENARSYVDNLVVTAAAV